MRNRYQSTSQSNTIQTTENTAVVYSIILDSNHPKYKDASDIGGVTFRMLSPLIAVDDTQLPVAYPFEKNFIDLPLINEKVSIYNDGSNITYKRIDNDVSGNTL